MGEELYDEDGMLRETIPNITLIQSENMNWAVFIDGEAINVDPGAIVVQSMEQKHPIITVTNTNGDLQEGDVVYTDDGDFEITVPSKSSYENQFVIVEPGPPEVKKKWWKRDR